MSQCINMACIGRETHGIGNSWDVTPPHMWLYKDICQLKMGVRFLITRIWFWCVVLSSFHQTGTAAWYTSSAACNPPPYETLIHSPRLCCWDLNGSIRKVNDKPEKPTAVHQQYNATAYDAQLSRVIIWKHLHRVRVQSVHHVPSNKENH